MRERGIAGASVDDVMEAAGLTRGGFYAHFRDKTALAREAIDFAFERAASLWLGHDSAQGQPWRKRTAARYLSEHQLDHVGEGCAAPALAAEVARSEPELRTQMGTSLDKIIQGIASRIGGDPATSRARAIAFLATCVGGLSLARAVGSRAMAREIMDACRAALSSPDGDA